MWLWIAHFLAVIVLVLGSVCCWALTFLSLPGNWAIVTLAALFAWMAPAAAAPDVTWTTVFVLLALAAAGEVVESMAAAAGAAKKGGSRRGAALALVGAIGGSILGVAIGLPIPVLGSAVAAVAGGAIGAFGGAVLGEQWKGRPIDQQLEVGRAALLGRLTGTAGKLIVGAIMVVVITADAIF
jgi:uncharacterized protein YqgC (DUF456 family)